MLMSISGLALGCGDLTSSQISPEPRSRANTSVVNVSGTDYMWFQSEEEARAALVRPTVHTAIPYLKVYSGNEFEYRAEMRYYGNRGKISGTLTFSQGPQSMQPMQVEAAEGFVFDRNQTLKMEPKFIQAPAACGYGATLSLVYTAGLEVAIPHIGAWEPFARDVKHSNTMAYQPTCDCSSDKPGVTSGPSDPGYDPSDPNGDGCGDGTGGSGSGTQFQPGQYTGGETVNWNTGVGNGGRSACGSLAVVEYVCIDLWDPERGWVEWACGYVTTC
jgi:hypothetical protein